MIEATAAPQQVTIEQRVIAVISSPLALAGICKIQTGSDVAAFDPWDHQIDLWRYARLYRDLTVLKARQLGCTEAFMLLALWEAVSFTSGDDLVVSLNEREAGFNLSKATAMYDSTPDWFKDYFPERKRNAEEFRIGHGRTSAGIISLPSSENAGRGRNFRRAICDEFGRWDNADERMASIEPTVADTGSICRSSTAKGYNVLHTKFSGGVDPGVDPHLGNGTVRMFFGALARPGRTKEWVLAKRRGMEGKLGQQEYPLTPEEAFISSGNCVFDMEALTDLETYSCKPPEYRVTLEHDGSSMKEMGEVSVREDEAGLWRVWSWPMPGREYVISADPCGGGGGVDQAAAVVLDVQSWDEVACLHGRPEPEQLAEQLVLMGHLYGGYEVQTPVNLLQALVAMAGLPLLTRRGSWRPALLAPEANNTGAAVIAILKERHYPRIYQTETFDQRTQQKRQTLGWVTSQKTRPLAIAALQSAVREGSCGVRNAAAIAEMRRFEDPGNGKPEAAEGAHDDLVMAWAIGIAVLARSKPRTAEPPSEDTYTPRVSSKTGY